MNEFEMKAYLSQLNTSLVKNSETEVDVNDEHQLKIYTNWQEFNQALDKGEVYLNDEIHELAGDKYVITELKYCVKELDDDIKITPQYKYEKIK